MNSLYQRFGFDQLACWMNESDMELWAKELEELVTKGLDTKRFGDLPGWIEHLNALPDISAEKIELSWHILSLPIIEGQ